MHVCVWVCVRVCGGGHACLCVHVSVVCVCVCACMFVHTSICAGERVCVCMRVCAHKYLCRRTCVHVRVRTCIHKCRCKCVQSLWDKVSQPVPCPIPTLCTQSSPKSTKNRNGATWNGAICSGLACYVDTKLHNLYIKLSLRYPKTALLFSSLDCLSTTPWELVT